MFVLIQDMNKKFDGRDEHNCIPKKFQSFFGCSFGKPVAVVVVEQPPELCPAKQAAENVGNQKTGEKPCRGRNAKEPGGGLFQLSPVAENQPANNAQHQQSGINPAVN